MSLLVQRAQKELRKLRAALLDRAVPHLALSPRRTIKRFPAQPLDTNPWSGYTRGHGGIRDSSGEPLTTQQKPPPAIAGALAAANGD